MPTSSTQNAWLLLQDGTYFKGFAAGKTGTFGAEICFNTGMTGYQEIYTDPSYYGQIMINTNVHIGNYGIKGKLYKDFCEILLSFRQLAAICFHM